MSGYFRHRSTQYVNQAHISKITFDTSVPCVLAPLGEQQRIVAEIEKQFSRLDASEAGFAVARTKSKQYLRSLLDDACNGRLVPTEAELAREQNRKFETAETLRYRLVRTNAERERGDSPRTMFDEEIEVHAVEGPHALPEGWTWARVSEMGQSRLGRARTPDQQTGDHLRPYLRVANVYEDRIDTSDVLQMNFSPEEFETYALANGDVLLNEGQSLELVGRAAMYRGEVPGSCFQNTLIRFRAAEGVLPAYALIVFRHYMHSKRFQAIARWSTNIAHLGFGRFIELEFPLPPTAEQVRIVAEFERLSSMSAKQVDSVESLVGRCATLRLSIMHQAFSGKLVPQDPAEGTAAELLAQIRATLAQAKDAPKPLKPKRPSGSLTGGASAMTKRLPLHSALVEAKSKMSPDDLFKMCGFDDETVEDFFDELKREVEKGRIKEQKTANGIWLKAVA
jgi:type I restriction enzyme S subunit